MTYKYNKFINKLKKFFPESKYVLMTNEVEEGDMNLSRESLLKPSPWREDYPLDSKKVKEMRV